MTKINTTPVNTMSILGQWRYKVKPKSLTTKQHSTSFSATPTTEKAVTWSSTVTKYTIAQISCVVIASIMHRDLPSKAPPKSAASWKQDSFPCGFVEFEPDQGRYPHTRYKATTYVVFLGISPLNRFRKRTTYQPLKLKCSALKSNKFTYHGLIWMFKVAKISNF